MTKIEDFVSAFSSLAWGLPLVLLLMGGGLYLGFISGFKPLRLVGKAIEQVFFTKADKGNIESNMVSPFQALSTALASTIGMGNIAGVALAIHLGGPGVIFWMWVSAIIGMIIKFFTCSITLMYRKKMPDGTLEGGPMYFIEEGLGKRWKPLAVAFSLFGLVGAFPVFNVNQLTQATKDILLAPASFHDWKYAGLCIGIALTILTALVILGGLRRIGQTAEKFVPSMVVLYFLCVAYIIFSHVENLPNVVSLIFTEAFGPTLYNGNTLFGGALGGLILLGIRRGAFSNEAGIGTADLAHGASNQPEPLREGLSAMLGPLIDTLIVCTLTALAILITGVWQNTDANGVSLTLLAFQKAMPDFGAFLLYLCIAVFSFSSLFSFSYYGTKCTAYLIGKEKSTYYQYLYLGSIIIGATTSIELMINLIDGFYALMAIPTMTGTLLLAPKVIQRLKSMSESSW